MTTKKLVTFFFLLGFGYFYFLFFLSTFIVDNDVLLKYFAIMNLYLCPSWYFLGAILYSDFGFLSGTFEFLIKILLPGLMNGLFYALAGWIIWQGIFEKKKNYIYLIVFYFLTISLMVFNIS